ncbi:MAG: peroxide stress protein YaaA [Pseudomonadota bacterium]
MLILLSPSKKLDFESDAFPASSANPTAPEFLDDAAKIAKKAKGLKPRDFTKLMGISESLATLNHQRFQDFSLPFTEANARPAIYAFQGDVYVGFKAETMDDAERERAQTHIRILSGLYGLLRPLDLMQAYRLEMGTRFKVGRADDLYAFWRPKLAKALNAEDAPGEQVIVNLASQEYWKAVDVKQLKKPVITCQFKEIRDGKPRMISFFAKNARGAMARYIIDEAIGSASGLKGFDRDGYSFNADLSKDDLFVFTRVGEASAE